MHMICIVIVGHGMHGVKCSYNIRVNVTIISSYNTSSILANECPSLSLTNGVITYATDSIPDFEIGTVATHSCDPGFGLVGDMTRTCMNAGLFGVWSGSAPTCERKILLQRLLIRGGRTLLTFPH